MKRHRLSILLAAGLLASDARADSVAQVQTGKFISRETVLLLDPQGNPTAIPGASDTAVEPGDIVTFSFRFTPVPNGALRGMGGYITDYIPPNTEVVGARIIDRDGNTLPPITGGFTHDGWESRGSRAADYATWALEDGSLVQYYCDTGMFFSTDALTAREPNDDFLRLDNGVQMNPEPTGANALQTLLEVDPMDLAFAHNRWDWIQAMAFGTGGGGGQGAPVGGDINTFGSGNTPHRYGSAVAGPDTWYGYDAVFTPPDLIEPATMVPDDPGPWQRVAYPGSTTCTGAAATSENGPTGASMRVGVPFNGGWDLSVDNPLPPGTTAVRYAVGELVVGREYFAEISLRVLDTPLDPVQDADVNCAEVFGGDASEPKSGKDNTWRYFTPAPACVQLNLFFDLTVDKILAVPGDTLTYTIQGKNLSLLPRTGATVTFTYDAGVLDFVAATGSPNVTAGLLTWTLDTLDPGEEFAFTVTLDVAGGGLSTVARATFTSDDLPGGFTVAALTNVDSMAVIDLSMLAAPDETTAGSTTHYTLTIEDSGTGDATCGQCEALITLPAGFTVVPGTVLRDGVSVGDPTGGPPAYTFALLAVAAGASESIEFDAAIAPGTPAGVYTSDVQTFFDSAQVIEDAVLDVAPVLVDVVRSETPTLDAPILEGDACVSGGTTELDGTEIRVYVNGVQRGTTTSSGGSWMVCGLPPLFAGQHVTATAVASGEIESAPSTPVVVTGTDTTPACADGADNDGDGQTDYPADPGCTGLSDPDETDPPICADGVDNDMDGQTDYPDDPSCCSFVDMDEGDSGNCPPPPECADGIDNDGDTWVDYPADPGCESSIDGDETDVPPPPDGGGADMGKQTDDDGGGASLSDGGGVPNLGGVPESGVGGGCGCSIGAAPR